MRRITHREMRNNSGEVLRAVEAGESIEVTNNGRVAAWIVPPPDDPIEDLLARGEARAPLAPRAALRNLQRVRSDVPTREIVEDLRNPW